MKYLATFLSKGTVLGQSEVECDIQPHSVAYFCATCGDIWGRIFVKPVDAEQYWEAITAPCIKHKRTGIADWNAVPGSFLVGTELTKGAARVTAWARVMEHLPEGVLKQEFQVHEAHYEGKLNDERADQDGQQQP
jgi:hypothetical protein